jgi:predicted enzyme related to lactoylglutathione lyase
MTEISGYDEGTPCWVDLVTPDVEAAQHFYGLLFGWGFADTGEATGNYRLASVRGKVVAGVSKQQPESMGPSAWTTYLWAHDADAVASRVAGAGGRLLVGPVDVPGAGRVAVASDSAGAVFGLWQGRENRGAELANEPGAFAWNENLTDDPAAARAFYQEVFGYSYERLPDWPVEYDIFKIGGARRGGIGAKPAQVRAITPNSWNTCFSVADTDAAAEAATGNGGIVIIPPADTAVGRMAVVVDPQGASFSVISLRRRA